MRKLLILCILLVGCGDGTPPPEENHSAGSDRIRPAVCAGRFYPADSIELANMVDSLIMLSVNGTSGELREEPGIGTGLIAGVVPHAGYVYSGSTAADLFSAIRGESFDVVVLVGPVHQVGIEGFSVFSGSSYQTPLGEVPVDQEMADRLRESHPMASFVPAAHEAEHCLEVQLPFLQRSLAPGFSIVPILVGNADAEQLRYMAELILAESFDKRLLLLASSDLSHYPTRELADEVDSSTIQAVLAGDPQGFLSATSPGSMPQGLATYACGRLPIALVMFYAQYFPAMEARLLSRTTSAEYSGDDSQVVGYASIEFLSEKPDPGDWVLAESDAEALLDIAHASVLSAVTGNAFELPDDLPDDLYLPRGAFVTLKRNGQLRGCIGSLSAWEPLAETVADMARSAALEDPRFIPVSEAELDELEYEISVLTTLQIMEDPYSVRVGTDGLLIIGPGGRSGVLLPQVPVEQGWTEEDFLEGVCMKAGLPPQAYMDDVVLYRFQAQIIGEEADEPTR
jgi:MEMO1 family protein